MEAATFQEYLKFDRFLYFMYGKSPFAPNQWITMRFSATFIPAAGNSTAFSCSLAKAIVGSKQDAMMKTGQGKRQADP